MEVLAGQVSSETSLLGMQTVALLTMFSHALSFLCVLP